jgi:hypothetical protein
MRDNNKNLYQRDFHGRPFSYEHSNKFVFLHYHMFGQHCFPLENNICSTLHILYCIVHKQMILVSLCMHRYTVYLHTNFECIFVNAVALTHFVSVSDKMYRKETCQQCHLNYHICKNIVFCLLVSIWIVRPISLSDLNSSHQDVIPLITVFVVCYVTWLQM